MMIFGSRQQLPTTKLQQLHTAVKKAQQTKDASHRLGAFELHHPCQPTALPSCALQDIRTSNEQTGRIY
jgi:hypothetical protein